MNDLQDLLDYVAIRQLNARYNRLADAGEGTAYAECFTEDAEFTIVGNDTYVGRERIAQAAAATQVTVHVTTEPEIVIDGDTATQRVRMFSAYRAQDGSRNDFVATGLYIDELRRTSDGWLFFRRRCELDLDLAQVFEKMTLPPNLTH